MKQYIFFLLITLLLFSFSNMGITQTKENIERTQEVTLNGKPITLVGPKLKVGDFAPDFQVVTQASLIDEEMKMMNLNDFYGKIKVISLSDYRYASFGTHWGVLIKELRLLTRALFIVDKKNVIRYIEIVPDTTQAPDYERALNALKQLIHIE